MPWQSSADQTDKKHTDIFSRAPEGEAACERDTVIKNHTVVLEVVPRTTSTHSGVEGLSGPCRGRVPKTRSVARVVVNYPTVEYESIFRELTITQLRSTRGVGGAMACAEW